MKIAFLMSSLLLFSQNTFAGKILSEDREEYAVGDQKYIYTTSIVEESAVVEKWKREFEKYDVLPNTKNNLEGNYINVRTTDYKVLSERREGIDGLQTEEIQECVAILFWHPQTHKTGLYHFAPWDRTEYFASMDRKLLKNSLVRRDEFKVSLVTTYMTENLRRTVQSLESLGYTISALDTLDLVQEQGRTMGQQDHTTRTTYLDQEKTPYETYFGNGVPKKHVAISQKDGVISVKLNISK